ncbi:TonB-dependent receptor family protein [Oceanibaculum nanhaiense]|mgnify:CR=1 FL=1|uniref:TonB-dependent receptor family protein n=1 Tax=Oceanibaculum nanhaiense TaxID=1909734 RepID=UPI000A3B0820|nr:TonB-dependent receptor [Oceanibaculum nanhaiense]
MNRTYRSLLLAGAMALAGTETLAQTQTQTQTLSPIRIEVPAPAQRLTQPSAEQARQKIEQVPGGVDLVPAEEFREGRAATLKDALDYVPGIFIQPKFGEDSRLSIRGSGLARNFHLRGVKLLQDGVPVSLADGSGDFQEIDPLNIDYIEVFKGANALRYGSTALGGAINVHTPTGRDLANTKGGVLTRAEIGSDGYRRGQIAGGKYGADWDAYATLTTIQQDGYRDHTEQNNIRFNSNIGLRLSDRAETRFFIAYNDIDQQIAGSVSRDQALNDPRRAAAGNLALDYKRDIESIRLGNRTSIALEDGTASFGGYVVSRELIHPIFQVLDNTVLDYGVFGEYETDGQAFGMKQEYLVGLQLGRGTNDNLRYANVSGQKGALRYQSEDTAQNADLYGEARTWVRSDLAVILAAQAGYGTREVEDKFLSDGDASFDKSFTSFNPRLGLLWQAAPDWQLFGNLSRSTELPTLSDLSPTATAQIGAVDPQTAVTLEIGTRGSHGRLTWDVAVYRAWMKDEIQYFTAPNGQSYAQNADSTIHQGLELGLDVRLLDDLFAPAGGDSLTLRQAYTFSDFHFDGDAVYGDNKLPGAPRHYYRAELRYDHPAGFYVGPNVEWVPEAYYVDNANTTETVSYALLGLKAGYNDPAGWSLFIDGRNLTDERYIASASVSTTATPASAVFEPGFGRAVYAGVQVRW